MSDWRDRSACLDEDPELFFPDGGASHDDAKAVCEACSVRRPCLDFALRNHIQYGVYGGLTAAERERMETGVLRDLWCNFCARPFQFWWEGGRVPQHCSQRCREDARAESHRKYHAKAGR